MNPTEIVFCRAESEDLPAIQSLLTGSLLPIAGVADHLDAFWLATLEKQIVGCAGLELYGDTALLRSLAVFQAYRNQQIAGELIERTVLDARERSVNRIFLLTTTAQEYFARRGFSELPRASAPECLERSAEFQGACPASATFMQMVLTT